MDKRQIDNIELYNKGLNLIQEIKPVTFQIKGQHQKQLGVVAQDLQVLEPLAVNRNGQGVLSVDYESLLLLAVNSIKELKAEIDQLKTGTGSTPQKAVVKEKDITYRKSKVS